MKNGLLSELEKVRCGPLLSEGSSAAKIVLATANITNRAHAAPQPILDSQHIYVISEERGSQEVGHPRD